MLVSLRRRASPPLPRERDELLQLLLACHTRIRAFARLAEEMGRRRDLPAHEVADACRRCARYFEEALPLHVVDEEQSLVPRLIHRDRALDACLEAMQAQHVQHTAGTHALIAALHATECAPDDELVARGEHRARFDRRALMRSTLARRALRRDDRSDNRRPRQKRTDRERLANWAAHARDGATLTRRRDDATNNTIVAPLRRCVRPKTYRIAGRAT